MNPDEKVMIDARDLVKVLGFTSYWWSKVPREEAAAELLKVVRDCAAFQERNGPLIGELSDFVRRVK